MTRMTATTAYAAVTRILSLVTAGLMLTASTAAADSAAGTIGIVLSRPSESAPAAYSKLFEAAGRPATESLPLTKSEVWTIAGGRWNMVAAMAAQLGIQVRALGENWNRVFVPMSHGASMTDRQKLMMAQAMQSKAAVGMSMMALSDPILEEYALTKGAHGVADGEPAALLIALSDNLSVSVRRTSVARVAGGYAWHGNIEETGEPVTLLWWPAGKMTGTAIYRGRIYAIHSMGGGMHGVVQMNPDALPQDHAPMTGGAQPNGKREKDPLVAKGDASAMLGPIQRHDGHSPESHAPRRSDTKNREDAAPGKLALAMPNAMPLTITPSPVLKPDIPVKIRIIVAYTAAAARAYLDIETDLVALAIEQANQSFRDSGVGNVQLELAHAYQTDYVENGTHFDHVFRFADRGDGVAEEVHALRDKYQADIGILIVDDANGCGLAAEVFARPERAFAVVHHECAATMYSFAHEIGHLIGARHDEALDDSAMPFSYGHGFVHGNEWRTMMSYKDSCGGCLRLPIWSNPAVLVRGENAGDALSDNARVIAENAARVAGFR